MGNTCYYYYSLEKILSNHLLSKKLKVNRPTYKTVIGPINKAKAMVIGGRPKKIDMRIKDESVEQVDSFKYL